MPILHSLLTAINTYHPSSEVPPLQGCHNDIYRWKSFLEEHFPKERLNMATLLLDGDATYQNVVHYFGDEFLSRAKKGDTVLFVYSGHGSRENAAQEFGPYYPEGMQETLVLYDSRTPGGLDLADKELAILIERIALKGVNVVVVLDCCHSGSGTRAMEDFTLGAVRQALTREGARPFESYLNGAFMKRNDGKGFYLPNSRHILLAACDRKEKAYELTNKRGLFSTSLLDILEDTGGQLSYADLFTRCRIGMSRLTDKQHPQFETYGLFNGYDGFLGLGSASEGAPIRVFFDKDTWQASMGAVHGLPVDNPIQIKVLHEGQMLGLATSKVVGLEATTLEKPGFSLQSGKDYEASLQSMEVPKQLVALVTDTVQTQMVMELLTKFKPIYFDLQIELPLAYFRMEVSNEKILLYRNADGLRLRTIEGNNWGLMLQDAFEKLELIARWERTLELDNKNSKINHDDLELILSELDGQGNILRETSEKEVVIDILRLESGEQKVPFRLEVRNKNKEKTRHCALFYASGNYGFSSLGFNEPVPPDSTTIAMEKNPKGVQYEFELKGKNEETDIFKLFVCNTKISGEALQQKGFKLGETVRFEQTRDIMRGGIQVSKAKGVFGMDDEAETEDINDWYTITLQIRCVAVKTGVGKNVLSLAGNFIKVLAHPLFKASVGLGSASSGTRCIEPMATVAELARYANIELLSFGETTKDIAPVNMLELTEIKNEDSLHEYPLQLEIAANLQKTDEFEESLLSLTFDGEHILPIGLSERMNNGNALISISYLPETVDKRRRSLGKALKLCFLKLVLKKKKVQYLRWVDFRDDKVERRSDDLKSKVDEANNILLLLHGIIGDTKGMAECMRPLAKKSKGDNSTFDLVLTFDYENLNTPIQETAGKLADLLQAAGITSGSGKKITIVAHSMGGLVSRYFIQNLGGHKVVQHLVLAGTPNGGSAISKITTYRDYAIPVLALLVNLPWGLPAAATVLGFLQNSKDLTLTLAQMDWDNDGWLKNLSKGSLRGVRCDIIAGHLDKYLEHNADHQKLMDKVYKLGGKLFYGAQPNDLAVSVESIKAIEGAASAVDVACHHLCYFEEVVSVGLLMELLKEVK